MRIPKHERPDSYRRGTGIPPHSIHPDQWRNVEIVQVDLPSGYRVHWFTRLTKYRFIDGVQHAETSYNGQVVRFREVASVIDNEASHDWVPVDAKGRRIRFELPQVEAQIVRLEPWKTSSTAIRLDGEGILKGWTGVILSMYEMSFERDHYLHLHRLRELILDHYRPVFQITNDRHLTSAVVRHLERYLDDYNKRIKNEGIQAIQEAAHPIGARPAIHLDSVGAAR
jgi:hypothetical protein